MQVGKLYFTRHAIRQMFERRITTDQVRRVIETGEVITEYPDDKPYPSCLILGMLDGQALHAVIAYDEQANTGHVVTTYHPDPTRWTDDFRQRRTP